MHNLSINPSITCRCLPMDMCVCVPPPTHTQANLYSLVWRRAMASQMEAAELEQVRSFH